MLIRSQYTHQPEFKLELGTSQYHHISGKLKDPFKPTMRSLIVCFLEVHCASYN